jgi:hypothetical protein
MAELLGVIGSIIAVATMTTQLSNSLYRIARSIGSVGDEVNRFAMETADFSSLMRLTHMSLSSHCSQIIKQDESSVLRTITELEVFDQLVDHCEGINSDIKKIKPHLWSLKSRLSIISRIKWLMQKSDVQTLGWTMDKMKSSLNLLVALVAFEAAQQERKSPKIMYGTKIVFDLSIRLTIRNSHDLRRQIRLLLRTQKSLEKRLRDSQGGEQLRTTRQFDAEAVLIDLGERIANHTSTTSRSQRRSIRRSPPTRNLRTTASIPRQNVPPTNAPIVNVASPSTSASSIIGTSSSTTPPVLVSSSSSSTTSNERSAALIAAQPNLRIIKMDGLNTVQATTGMINDIKVTARVDPNLEENFMGEREAARLNLEIRHPSTSDETTIFDLGQGRFEHPIGMVTCQWSKETLPNVRLFSLRFLVCRQGVWPLILGQPYLRRLQKIRSGGSGADQETSLS